MRTWRTALLFALAGAAPLMAKTVVFWQEGFPTIASEPIPKDALNQTLGADTTYADLKSLADSLKGADLLVLPYGSAVPVEGWGSIQAYLKTGGNLLVLGGQALRVPVRSQNGVFVAGTPQDSYSRELSIQHTYEVPVSEKARFTWKSGFTFLKPVQIQAKRFFTLEDGAKGHLNGLGFLVEGGLEVAAPVVFQQQMGAGDPRSGSRIVMLDFEPTKGYWSSADGISLVQQSAAYALRGATHFQVEVLFSTVKAGETPQLTLRYRNARRERLGQSSSGEARVELLSGSQILETVNLACTGKTDLAVPMQKRLDPGFYTLRATYSEAGQPCEFYENGFWVEDAKLLATGPALGVKGDFLSLGGKPFFPYGSNHFTTEMNGWDFSSPRNAAVWERDFSEMEKAGHTFVRTGVWMPNSRFFEETSGSVNERFLRNLEAYLFSARRHHIAVNFTFFAFAPRSGNAFGDPNPYMDPGALGNQKDYVLSVVQRFKDVPWLSWDLINEPSFSNPKRLWKGNTPNGDGVERNLWHTWLKARYGALEALADAWRVTPEQLGSFDAISLPAWEDLAPERYGNTKLVRAFDYNLFAQETFARWAKTMVDAIRSTGSQQLVNVGHDEGGVTDRVLNRFFASNTGLAFTTNHTYWREDSLLWDSVAAKIPGMPCIVGETNYQPAWAPDGAWRWDEFTGFPLLERRMALGFAAGVSGSLIWDWDCEVDFGTKRSDGTNKIWVGMMREMGEFAKKAAGSAAAMIQPSVAIVLPQSHQLSIHNGDALEAQMRCVRALFHNARAEAYAVGEYQLEQLSRPKLIILPSPYALDAAAWKTLKAKAEAGATLLITGPFDLDAHFHPTDRLAELGLKGQPGFITLREQVLKLGKSELRVAYGGDKVNSLNCTELEGGANWIEQPLGKGRLLFSTLPLELNDNAQVLGEVYAHALKEAAVEPTYTTTLKDPGILICPTRFPEATLYVLTSESTAKAVNFKDVRSGKTFSGELAPGRAAMLLVGTDGVLKASYNWK